MVWKVASITLLLASIGWAQSSGDALAPSGQRSPFASPVRERQDQPATPGKTASPAAKPAGNAATKPKPASTSAAHTAAGSRAKTAATPGKTVSAANKPAPAAAPASDATGAKLTGRERDPFASPVTASQSEPCTTGGKKCLVIGRIALRGIVQAASGYIAVVVNSSNRAYFLRVNDPVFDGYVERITSNTVIFKETGKDRFGHPVLRDVTKILGAPSA